MQETVSRLFPAPRCELPLEGLYLKQDLHTAREPGTPFVYSNFVASLDGRIAIATRQHATYQVPPATANPRDWRLYQELAGQADILIVSGRYFRQSQQGEAQDDLPLGRQEAFDDIRKWRAAQGLAPQPDIAIMSSSLDLPPAALAAYRARKIRVITGEAADPQRALALEEDGIHVIRAGRGQTVDGRLLVDELGRLGYRSVYAIAGPAVFHTLAAAGVLDRLFLTITLQILGGERYATLSRGGLLDPPLGMRLAALYHDPHAPANAGQLLGIFDSRDRSASAQRRGP